ncbi:DUF2235 domain-containing protein [Thetidibacter halocola]|uniref:DUF2235 domain-containing protein n=1 Tax=Thetidibacter halocola TaxID=2827239 RepID=A0A8J8B6G7_9RHOB|nr:DUF2235 domain-containing protein [Thetidibacter halocola]MBS0122550.1 DUF2235 domain-containing protein [Thetidibacter halocola]
MRIYCCIDGTDNADPSGNAVQRACVMLEGTQSMTNGHVKRIASLGFDRHKYFPGTQDSVTGRSSAQIVEQALNWILANYGSSPNPDRKLFLGGFSRGGAAMIVIAHRLQQRRIPVQEMYLFDAVDRSFWMDDDQTNSIPGNVTMAFHALRDPLSGSRVSFGNCGLYGTGANVLPATFMTTHGGVGGWPNGEAMVKPGVGPEDYMYMARLGPVIGAAAAASDRRRHNIHESGEPWPSNITPAQERAGMRRAWDWMFGKAFSTLGAAYSS